MRSEGCAPWELAEEVRADDTLEDGSQRIFRFPMGPIKMSWVAEHSGYNPPHSFEDTMLGTIQIMASQA